MDCCRDSPYCDGWAAADVMLAGAECFVTGAADFGE